MMMIAPQIPFDRILLKDLHFSAIIGVFPEERLQPQAIELDVVLQTLPLLACKTDDLDQTISYADVYDQIRDLVEKSQPKLVEHLAGLVAERLLSLHPSLMIVDVEVRKPQAPLPGEFKAAGVAISRCRADFGLYTTADLSLGSNLGDRLETLRTAVQLLASHPLVRLKQASSVYETTPVGLREQPDFLNMVLRVETCLDPFKLLLLCQQIEARFLRERLVHWGPRTLDIDILTYGDLAADTPILTLPHPRMAERDFVQVPLQELASGAVQPTPEVRFTCKLE